MLASPQHQQLSQQRSPKRKPKVWRHDSISYLILLALKLGPRLWQATTRLVGPSHERISLVPCSGEPCLHRNWILPRHWAIHSARPWRYRGKGAYSPASTYLLASPLSSNLSLANAKCILYTVNNAGKCPDRDALLMRIGGCQLRQLIRGCRGGSRADQAVGWGRHHCAGRLVQEGGY